MYADDLVIIEECKQELHEVLEEWKEVFKKHRLRNSLEKTEMMWVGDQREELNIRLDGKETKEVDDFVYLGGMVSSVVKCLCLRGRCIFSEDVFIMNASVVRLVYIMAIMDRRISSPKHG